jgi:hypothetical protein
VEVSIRSTVRTGGIPDQAFREECMQKYHWPLEIRERLAEELRRLQFDRDHLLELATNGAQAGFLPLTFVSREYLPLGMMWARCLLRAGLENFVVAAVDEETRDAMRGCGIPCVRVEVPSTLAALDYRNYGGFSGKGLSTIASRTLVVRFLVQHGYNVLLSDADALFLADPTRHISDEAGIAFQRVVYFPKPVVRLWGFAACAGCVAYRSGPGVVALLDHMVSLLEEVSSDQIALNLAMVEAGARWADTTAADTEDGDSGAFAALADQRLQGRLSSGVVLEALPATSFWRHNFVPLRRDRSVVIHPNAPKELSAKMLILREILGDGDLAVLLAREG